MLINRQQIVELYRVSSWGTRLHVKGRMRLFPFEDLLYHLPQDCRGPMLDLGCGHGLWPFFLAKQFPDAHIYAIDPDDGKILVANEVRSHNRIENITFLEGEAPDVNIDDCSVQSVIDVMYLIPFEQQECLLRLLYAKLAPGGILLLKEMSYVPRWKFRWNLIEEWLAVRALNITVGREFYFRPEEEWTILLESIGFSVDKYRLDKGFLHPHLLFVATKQNLVS